MGKYKFRVTKENKEQIAIAVKGFPVEYHAITYKRSKVKGKKLIEKGVTHIKKDGDIIEVEPNAYYVQNERLLINHQKEAENEFRMGGMPALTAYIVKVLDRKKQRNEKDRLAVN